jgi:hypothetical protein
MLCAHGPAVPAQEAAQLAAPVVGDDAKAPPEEACPRLYVPSHPSFETQVSAREALAEPLTKKSPPLPTAGRAPASVASPYLLKFGSGISTYNPLYTSTTQASDPTGPWAGPVISPYHPFPQSLIAPRSGAVAPTSVGEARLLPPAVTLGAIVASPD